MFRQRYHELLSVATMAFHLHGACEILEHFVLVWGSFLKAVP
jgi:hypothetical protein